jgi:thiamine-phosphate pyrophosphorylase
LLLCYITDRNQFAGTRQERRDHLLAKIAEAAGYGVDFIQLREKDLPARELEELALAASAAIAQHGQRSSARSGPKTRLLVNSRADVAIASRAGGVHLPSGELSPGAARRAWRREAVEGARTGHRPTIGVSCHSPEEVRRAEQEGADLVVFGPIFEKTVFSNGQSRPARALGIEALELVRHSRIPVLALGGITLENGPACVRAGAGGVAAIRLFQQNDIARVVRALVDPRRQPC